jgi:hypothetical protein
MDVIYGVRPAPFSQTKPGEKNGTWACGAFSGFLGRVIIGAPNESSLAPNKSDFCFGYFTGYLPLVGAGITPSKRVNESHRGGGGSPTLRLSPRRND